MVDARSLFNNIKQSGAVRAAGAVARFIGAGGVTVSADVYEARMAACRGCTHYIPGEAPVCGVCGCFLKVKTRFPAEQCPLNPPKWPQESDVPKEKQCGACT